MHLTIRRIGLTLIALLVVLLLLGVTYQGIATAFERRDYPPPGHLVDVGGHQLHVSCAGTGGVAVVLEAPETGLSASWGLVQPLLARRTRVCSYDRAGLGWSEAGGRTFTPDGVPTELHAALLAEHVPGPWVLVGQSMGAALTRLFAARYPTEVAGLVLVDDPLSPTMGPASGDPEALAASLRLAPWLARTGLLRLGRLLAAPPGAMPPAAAGALASFLLRPDHLSRSGRELAQWRTTRALAVAAALPDTLAIARVATEHAAPGAGVSHPRDADRVAAATITIIDSLRSR